MDRLTIMLISSIVSLFALVLITLILCYTGKFKIKTEPIVNISYLGGTVSFWGSALLVWMLVVLMDETNHIVYQRIDVSMTSAVDETNVYISNASRTLKSVAEIRANTEALTSKFALVAVTLSNNVRFRSLKTTGDAILSNLRVTVQEFDKFNRWFEELNIPSNCAIKSEINLNRFEEGFRGVHTALKSISENVHGMENRFTNLKDVLMINVEKQKKLIFDQSQISTHRKKMNFMLDHFKGDIDSTEGTRRRFVQDMIDLAPDKHAIAKRIVYFISIAIIILQFSIIFAYGRCSCCESCLVLSIVIVSTITGILLIGMCATSIAFSFGLVGYFDCPLAKGPFGLSNFTSPLPGQERLSMCRSPGAPTFFHRLGNYSALTLNNVVNGIRIESYKTEIWRFIGETLGKVETPSKYNSSSKALKGGMMELNVFFNNSCIELDKKLQFKPFWKTFTDFADEVDQLKVSIDILNEKLNNANVLYNTLLDESYTEVTIFIYESIGIIQKQISIVDFRCSPMLDLYSMADKLICSQVDPELGVFSISFIILIISLLIALILQMLMMMQLRIENQMDRLEAEREATRIA